MATRAEKVFRSNVINEMNDILSEINSVLMDKKSKSDVKEWMEMNKKLIRSISGFYKNNGISDEEIIQAVTRGIKKW